MPALHKKPFYYSVIRKYVVLMGNLFSNVEIVRLSENAEGAPELSRERVPISYAPKEKFYVRTTEAPDLAKKVAIKLPRMGFEMTSMTYDISRKLNNYNKMRSHGSVNTVFQYTPVPYNFNFSLYVTCKTQEESTQIIEQIVPFFTPDVTVTINSQPFLDHQLDVPVVLNSCTPEDSYDGDFITRREIRWTLDFTMRGYVYGPTRGIGVIRRNDINYFDIVSRQLLANQHTELSHPTIPRESITEDDDYGFTDTFTENV